MNPRIAALLLVLSVVGPALAQDIAEPRSGVKFATKEGDTTLLGVALRTKTFAKIKVYAIGLYVADSALSGFLKGKAGSPDLYKELQNGDFKKKVIMKFVRDVSTGQVQDAFRDSLKGMGGSTEAWIAYFNDIRSGQECVIAWTPGTGLETRVAGTDKPPINDKSLASAVFGIWLGDKPVQDDLKKDLVSRSPDLLK
jgi:hypothetical protein